MKLYNKVLHFAQCQGSVAEHSTANVDKLHGLAKVDRDLKIQTRSRMGHVYVKVTTVPCIYRKFHPFSC